MNWMLRIVLVVAVTLAQGGAPLRAQDGASKPPPVSEVEAVIPVGPGDVVSIVVFPVNEYSREVTIQPDDKIEIPLIGSIQGKGLNSRQIQDLLHERYAKFVADPKITVNVRRFKGRRVAIIGQVRSPGYFEYRDGMTLLELVASNVHILGVVLNDMQSSEMGPAYSYYHGYSHYYAKQEPQDL